MAQWPHSVLGAVPHEVLGGLGSPQLTALISLGCAPSASWSRVVARALVLTFSFQVARHRMKRRENFTSLSLLRKILKAATRHFHLCFVDSNLVSWSCLAAEEAGKCVLAGHMPRVLLLGCHVV